MAYTFPDALWGDTTARFEAKVARGHNVGTVFASLVFCFKNGNFVLANIRDRGWSVPGGRLEAGESDAEAARREVVEEIGATVIDLDYIGEYVLCDVPSGESPVKPVRYVSVFVGAIGEIGDRPEGSESLDVAEFGLADLPTRYYRWDPLLSAVCQYAYESAQRLSWLT